MFARFVAAQALRHRGLIIDLDAFDARISECASEIIVVTSVVALLSATKVTSILGTGAGSRAR